MEGGGKGGGMDGWMDAWRENLRGKSQGHGPIALFCCSPYQQCFLN